ncbi:2-amino-4-hydroxy-6-hydroxymethyldihydropteridine diphosphokinase [Kineosporia sp. NBRC 101731]|uniref:2-amino-4-hydroxy-6- hydroxymethyldihydropteridine diphosphokinase n=1 Tax=Kineosporia sp. NBRC 101731 TaxID=3032199 RepID=UPI0024A2043F|nr:2-amino-4-hydroxy-6-hydroxymethyldihydropteridine diphosphokinase [Kineosporia sp. NBRC 101731]GLY27546.1 7,8-dihydroneopterin aldolase [Kineosporia sp. NBRC 101731]
MSTGLGFGPITQGSGRLLDQIRLSGVTARGTHGVFDFERREGQDFVVDVVLHTDISAAAASDDLTRTTHYGELAGTVADIVRGDPVDLIETLAERIAWACLEPPGVFAVDVAVHKPQAPIEETFGDVVVAIRRERTILLERAPAAPVPVVLALGTNMGDRLMILRGAVRDLRAVEGLEIDVISPVIQTDPVGGPDQPDYLNAVVLATSTLSANDVLAACNRIEGEFGRERTVRWGPRTLDIDVISYGELRSYDEKLTLPHPRAHERAFVLAPWLAADEHATLLTDSGPEKVATLLERAPDRISLRQRPELTLEHWA